MSYRLIEDVAGTKKVIGFGMSLKEAYELLKVECGKDKAALTAPYEDLEYAIEQQNGVAYLYRFWGYYKIEDESSED